MRKFKQFIEDKDHENPQNDEVGGINPFVGGLRAPTTMLHIPGDGNSDTTNEEYLGCEGCVVSEVALQLPGRAGASDSTAHIGTRHHESNDSIIADHLNRSPDNIAAFVHKDEGENSATHVYDHKHNRFHKIHDGDENDAIENNKNADGSKGGVRGLKIKGSSSDVKEQAGAFVHHATDNPLPDHPEGRGVRRVLEINAATHRHGAERPEALEADGHKDAKKKARAAQAAETQRPPSMAHHPAMNGGTQAEHDQYHKIHEYGHQLGKKIGNIHARIRDGYGKVASKLNSDYDPRKDRKATNEANDADKTMQKEHGMSGKTPRKLTGGSSKIDKSRGVGDITVGVSGAPASTHGMAGHNSCPESSTECRGGCLGFSTGKNAMLSNLISKMSKSQFQAKHPEHHAHKVVSELLNHVDTVAAHNSEVNKARKLKPGEKHAVRVGGTGLFTAHKPGTKAAGDVHGHLEHDGNGNVTYTPSAKFAKKREADHADATKAAIKAGKKLPKKPAPMAVPSTDHLNASWRPNMYTDHPPGVMHLHAIHNHLRKYAAKKGMEWTTRDYTKNPGTMKQQHPEGYYVAASSTGPDVRRG